MSRDGTVSPARQEVDSLANTVVLDLSWIRALPRNYRRFHRQVRCIIPDGLFGEIAGSDIPDQLGDKMYTLFQSNRGRMFIGTMWKTIADEECRRGRPIEAREIINHTATTSLCRCLADNGVKAWMWAFRATAESDRFRSNEIKRGEFLALAANFAEWFQEKSPEAVRSLGSIQRQRDWIQDPRLVAEAAGHFFPEYASDGWPTRLQGFPDRFAVCRWMRIIAWTCLKKATGATRGISNDWDDAQYAYLASYAGGLVTADQHLKKTMALLFPDVRMYDAP
jgi:hypothetical protein